MAAIEIQGLEKRYRTGFWRQREKVGLYPLTLSVESGEVFGYLGPNGAGKTTTLKLLLGLVFPSAGSARILGLDCRDPRVKARVGFLPEQPYFYDHLTATELLMYFAQLSGVAARERSRRVQHALERVRLTGTGRTQLRKFSKGMLQRVGIAQAILHDPDVVFLDEPMSGLDPIGRREVRDLIQELKDEGKTVLFSTHILSDAEALCDRVAVLHLGKLRAVGAVAALTSEMSGRVELLLQGALAAPALSQLGAEVHTVGETVRAVVPEAQQDAALEAARSAHARLVALTPLRATLEDYFVQKLGAEAQPVAPLRAHEVRQ